MDHAELERKLIAIARANPPGDHVPYAFEKRVMARLASWPVPDLWTQWSNGLWRAAVSCVAVMLLLGAWSVYSPVGPTSSGDLSQEFENTVLAAVEQDSAGDSSW
jgi:hypothetical protein